MTIQQALSSPLLSRGNELVLNLMNAVSGGTAGVSKAKDMLRSGSTLVDSNTLSVHFLKELRRVLSGDTSPRFSSNELVDYLAYIDSIDNDTPLTPTSIIIDEWLVNELQNLPHPEFSREYNILTHPWRKRDGTNTQG